MTWTEHCEAVAAGGTGFIVVEVVWNDAVALGLDWTTEADDLLRMTTTVGYLVKETKRALTLVSIINTEHIGHGIVIPKSTVIARRTLR